MTNVVAQRVDQDDLADRVVAAMRMHRSPSHPRAFEVWYAHLSGTIPALSAELQQGVDNGGFVGATVIDGLYHRYLATERLAQEANRTSSQILEEIAGLTRQINEAVDASELYHSEISALSQQGPASADRTMLRQWVETLVLSTQSEVARKTTLESKLRDSAREISHLRDALETSRIEAQTDALTGLANRRHFEERLQACLEVATSDGIPLTLVIADVDYFKRFNDDHGHATGDQVLRLVAQTMTEHMVDRAVITRFGGEEFAIILPDTNLNDGKLYAESVRQALLKRELIKRSTNEKLGRITISSGVAAYKLGDTPTSLIERADQALLAAKRTGRNRTVTQDALTR
ncbi:GGDEF domain-containing protein [Bosea sp. (in: a-proteobacteria)]|uniref:GGDEF domain-containing protein n=1 Tax=Bosea sp. (in: a-proteobacteria) TaxID=1871050 RepID=UPI002B4A7D57|nr:GGDEF domain-containing protein [Bosea sp. (in: a-proteobacteria)]WRH57569.1 MAG: GGDEF domain-containing protein [Bosea sp. (in: a-proteobacteria)]